MALRVVTDKCTSGDNRGTVVLEGDSPEEVMNMQAKQAAIRHAQTMGISRAGISNGGGPYPVDANGEGGNDAVATANAAGRKYRYDWPVQGGI